MYTIHHIKRGKAMKYCTKCKKIENDLQRANCRFCGKALIDNPSHYSPVHIVTANGFELERIKAALTEADIPFTVQQTKDDTGLQILNAAPMENCQVFVPLAYYTDSTSLLIGIGALREAEELDEEEEKRLQEERKKTEEELSPQKRFWVRLLSIIAFIGLVAAVVFLADLIGKLINPNFH